MTSTAPPLNVPPCASDPSAVAETGILREGQLYDLAERLAEDPWSAELNLAYGGLLSADGRVEQGLDHVLAAVASEPHNLRARLTAGRLLLARGRLHEAASHLEQATRTEPGNALVWTALGVAEQRREQLASARSCYERAATDDRYCVGARLALAALDLSTDRSSVAYRRLTLAREALAEDESTRGVFRLASMPTDLAEEVCQLLLDLFDAPAGAPGLAVAYGLLARHPTRSRRAVDLLEAALRTPLDTSLRQLAHFVLADRLDGLGRPAAALEHYHRANALKTTDYDAAGSRRTFNHLRAVFSPARFSELPRASERSSMPIVLLGQPYSGVRTLQRLLERHSGIRSAGERPDLPLLAANLEHLSPTRAPWPEALVDIDTQSLDTLTSAYLTRTRALGRRVRHVADRPHDSHLHVGLVHLALPDAPLIHCVRDLHETAVSIYFHDPSGHHPYAANLADLEAHLQQVETLMAHWRDVLGIEMLQVRYEDLLADPEGILRELVDTLGLPWEDGIIARSQPAEPQRGSLWSRFGTRLSQAGPARNTSVR